MVSLTGLADMMIDEGERVIDPLTVLVARPPEDTIPVTGARRLEIARVRAPTLGYHLTGEHLRGHEVVRPTITGVALEPLPSRLEAMVLVLTGEDDLLRDASPPEEMIELGLLLRHGDPGHHTARADRAMYLAAAAAREEPGMQLQEAKARAHGEILPR